MIHFLMAPILVSVAASFLPGQDTPHENSPALATNTTKSHNTLRTKASELIGCNITNTKNESLGEIQDIVLDGKSEHIAYAVIAFGGFLGMGEKYFAMPWHYFDIEQRSADDKPRATLGLDPLTLKAAPGFDKSQWPDMASHAWAKQVDDYYRMRNEKAKAAGAPEPKGSAADGTSGVNRPPTSDMFAHRRLSHLIGMSVVDASYKPLADVEDLVVDAKAATVDGMLLSFGGLLGIGESIALLPAEQLTIDPIKQVFVFPCTTAGLKKMALKNGVWPTLSDDQWLTQGLALCATHCDPIGSGDVLLVEAAAGKSVPFADSYDIDKVETIKGTITTIGSVRIGDHKEQRVRLRVFVNKDREVIIYAAPANFETQRMLGMRKGTAVLIDGSPAQYGSQIVLVAGSITVDGNTADLRDKNGEPTWNKK